MTGSAKQSILSLRWQMDCFVARAPRMTWRGRLLDPPGAVIAGRRDALPLAHHVHSAYIGGAKLCRASGAIYPRGLIDPSGNCPWPGPWIRSYGAHLLS